MRPVPFHADDLLQVPLQLRKAEYLRMMVNGHWWSDGAWPVDRAHLGFDPLPWEVLSDWLEEHDYPGMARLCRLQAARVRTIRWRP